MRSFRILSFLIVAVLMAAACSPKGDAGKSAAATNPAEAACTLNDDSTVFAGRASGAAESVLPNGRWLRPSGAVIDIAAIFPWGVTLNHAGTYAYVTSSGPVRNQDAANPATPYGYPLYVVDVAAGTAARKYVNLLGSSNGLVAASDDKLLYVAGGVSGQVEVLDIGTDPAAPVNVRSIKLSVSYINGLALSPDESTLYALDGSSGRLFKVNLADDTFQQITVGFHPQEIVLTRDGATAYISNPYGNTVAVVDTAALSLTHTIATGKSPYGLALSGDESLLYVALTDDAAVQVVNTVTKTVLTTIELEEDAELKALAPTALHLDVAGNRLYVAVSYMNALYVIDTGVTNYPVFAKLPTGMYPNALAMKEGSSTMVVVNAMGWGGLPNGVNGHFTGNPTNSTPGNVSLLPIPADDPGWAAATVIVDANNGRPGTFYSGDCEQLVPLDDNGDPVIKHIVLIVKENKTYDEVLGDLKDYDGNPLGDGDPALTLFGEEITPNAHELARRFVVGDNFYCDSEVSLQGHVWTTHADCNDTTNRARLDQLALAGVDEAGTPATESIFEALLRQGISFRNYGEVVAFIDHSLGDMRDHMDVKMSFYNMGVSDVDKAREIVREIDNGIFQAFTYVSLPNDHTFGGDAGKPTPRFMVADNDYGFGLIVEAISHSKYWENTIIFVVQDDTQSAAGDHIDAHRAPFFVISPWVKKGHLTSVHYSFPSVYRTIEMLLGIPHLTRHTALAAPMYDIFTDTPDYSAYTAIKPDVPWEVNGSSTEAAAASKAFNWDFIDGHKGLGDIIWKIMRPGQERPSYAKRIDE